MYHNMNEDIYMILNYPIGLCCAFLHFCFPKRFSIYEICVLFISFHIYISFYYRAFVRILCVCCPRKIRRKYQPTMRSKASQVNIDCSFFFLLLFSVYYFLWTYTISGLVFVVSLLLFYQDFIKI